MSNVDSIARMNAGAFILSDLTAPNFDSIAKTNSIVDVKTKSGNISVPATPEYTDWSGLIHLQIFYSITGQEHHPTTVAQVPADFVLVGGGAQTSNDGGFITESRPDGLLTTWYGSSTDHIESNLHVLTVYAIGMKIDGVTPDYLRSKIHVVSQTSSTTNHPFISITIESNCLLIGGGAKDNYDPTSWGNMLVSSYPGSSTTWYAGGKDHRKAAVASVTAYAIGIENISFPNVGYIQVGSYAAQNYVSYGGCSATATIPTGWALTCCGGNVDYGGTTGRMITGLYPNYTSQATFTSRDNGIQSSGYNYAYALAIQKAR